MSPFWPQHLADPVEDPPRRKWDDWGPREQELNLRAGIGDILFDSLAQLEKNNGLQTLKCGVQGAAGAGVSCAFGNCPTGDGGGVSHCKNIKADDGGDMASDTVLKIFDELKKLHAMKDADYAGGKALGNFRRCEQFGVPAWKGTLIRLSDKYSRLVSLAGQDGAHQVKGESLVDTLNDLAVYAVIVRALLEEAPGEVAASAMEGRESTPYDYMKNDGVLREQKDVAARRIEEDRGWGSAVEAGP